MCDLPPEAYEDCFHPPSIPTQVFCLHCQEVYESYLIEWREEESPRGRRGFWRCPTPGCCGAGFGFDLHPVDPDYIDPDGRDLGEWCFDDEEEEDWDEESFDEPDVAMDAVEESALADPHDDHDPFAIPMDDLLPENEDVGTSKLTPHEMNEIERKTGWWTSSEGTDDGSEDDRSSRSSRPSSSGDERDWADDEDIPF